MLHENFNAEIDLFAHDIAPTKRCSRCKEQKALDCFGKDKSGKDGINCRCKKCNRDLTRELRSTPEGREKSREANRKLRSTPEGREKHREATRKILSTLEGREKHRAANLRHAKNHPRGHYSKLANDPLYKLQSNICSLIRCSLKKTGNKKSSKTAEILGCSIEEFKLHLQSQFTDGMTLENHGAVWELDHKVPISWARTEQEAIAFNHYSNFQPLLATENIAKGNRLSACGLTRAQWYEANPIPINKT